MKRRVTYVFDGDSPFEPDQAQLTDAALLIRDLHAAKEDRATFSFTELPAEVSTNFMNPERFGSS
jgi:hypothetical protein